MQGTRRFSLAALSALQLMLACATQARAPAIQAQTVVERPPELDEVEVRERVQNLLSEPSASAADWKPLGPGALLVLEQTISDARAPAAARGRAVEALALVDNAEATAKLKSIAQNGKVRPPLRSKAVAALAEREGAACAQPIKPVLSDPNRQLREQAVRSLASVGGPDARAALEERLPREEDARLRELIQRSVARMQP
jgi:HEAT repeat protein